VSVPATTRVKRLLRRRGLKVVPRSAFWDHVKGSVDIPMAKSTKPVPVLSVALPLYRAKKIAWLCLEGLCKQKDAPAWELLVAEENKPGSLGSHDIIGYMGRLARAGCVRLLYLNLNAWVPLSMKWAALGESAKGSVGFLLSAADCYSSPDRLCRTNVLLREGYHWVQAPSIHLYHLQTGRRLVYTGDPTIQPIDQMAFDIHLARQIPYVDRRSKVDSWLMRVCRAFVGDGFKLVADAEMQWRLSLNVRGHNNISDPTNLFDRPRDGYVPATKKLRLPKRIIKRLRCLQGSPEMPIRPWEKPID